MFSFEISISQSVDLSKYHLSARLYAKKPAKLQQFFDIRKFFAKKMLFYPKNHTKKCFFFFFLSKVCAKKAISKKGYQGNYVGWV